MANSSGTTRAEQAVAQQEYALPQTEPQSSYTQGQTRQQSDSDYLRDPLILFNIVLFAVCAAVCFALFGHPDEIDFLGAWAHWVGSISGIALMLIFGGFLGFLIGRFYRMTGKQRRAALKQNGFFFVLFGVLYAPLPDSLAWIKSVVVLTMLFAIITLFVLVAIAVRREPKRTLKEV